MGVAGGRLTPLLRGHKFWGLWMTQLIFTPRSATCLWHGLGQVPSFGLCGVCWVASKTIGEHHVGGVGPQWAPALTHSHCHSGPAAGPAIPTSNSYSKKTQSNNAENKRPEEDRESGRKASSTAKVPASPLPGLERKKTTPTPSTVSHVSPPPTPRPGSCSGVCLSSPGSSSLTPDHSLCLPTWPSLLGH